MTDQMNCCGAVERRPLHSRKVGVYIAHYQWYLKRRR